MHHYEAEELAARIAGIDPDKDNDYDAKAEQWLGEKWQISMEQFKEIAEALIPFTIPARTAITNELAQGFIHDGAFICKQPVKAAS